MYLTIFVAPLSLQQRRSRWSPDVTLARAPALSHPKRSFTTMTRLLMKMSGSWKYVAA